MPFLTRAKRVAPRYRFGYHTADDMVSQAVLYGLEAVEDGSYDASRPIENFMCRHMKNRLYNFLRKHYVRLEPPCTCCGPDTASPCKRRVDWTKRNRVKRGLMVASAINEETTAASRNHAVDDVSELEAAIDRGLPVDLRSDYRRMRDGVAVPKSRKLAVRDAVAAIAREVGYEI
jgi:DNA-directed RNA polymerase specialized sigma24 family protein